MKKSKSASQWDGGGGVGGGGGGGSGAVHESCIWRRELMAVSLFPFDASSTDFTTSASTEGNISPSCWCQSYVKVNSERKRSIYVLRLLVLKA